MIVDDADDIAFGVSERHFVRDDRVPVLRLAVVDESFARLHDAAIVGDEVFRLGRPRASASRACG